MHNNERYYKMMTYFHQMVAKKIPNLNHHSEEDELQQTIPHTQRLI